MPITRNSRKEKTMEQSLPIDGTVFVYDDGTLSITQEDSVIVVELSPRLIKAMIDFLRQVGVLPEKRYGR